METRVRTILLASIVMGLLLAVLISGISCTTEIVYVTAASTPTPTPTPSIYVPQGKGAIIGKVTWGGTPLASSTVEASTQNPAIVWSPEPRKDFSATTDDNGYYIMFVEPETYYVGCSMPGSKYLSYSTFGSSLLASSSYTIEAGKTVTVNLKAVDWSVKLISPGSTWSNNPPVTSNYPTLSWQDYDWGKYGEVRGYYVVELGMITNGWTAPLRLDR